MIKVRSTILVHQTNIDAANHWAAALGYGEGQGELKTFPSTPGWIDGVGELYSAASFLTDDRLTDRALGQFNRPAWDTTDLIDPGKVSQIQTSIRIRTVEDLPLSDNERRIRVNIIEGDNPRQLLDLFGVSQYDPV